MRSLGSFCNSLLNIIKDINFEFFELVAKFLNLRKLI